MAAVLAALGGETESSAPAATPPKRPARTTKQQPRRATKPSARAPRGTNRAAALRVLGERPGVSVGELSSVSGVKCPVLYALLSQLEERGEVVKRTLPNGTAGYSLPPTEFDAATADHTST
ncbi:MarR family winged helix-turn-helix transcriptional regulator [Solirubrobacter pauli]|uniref:MarR family winged helix-turn-helix transcriptional regulator n=1 Tax=Solirubrobacter pauli TaxID=166793 RepID=UPI0011C42938|nr:MarR family winged helix-turn-helix transcriptional regulator [Solirubrobacter pauli]